MIDSGLVYIPVPYKSVCHWMTRRFGAEWGRHLVLRSLGALTCRGWACDAHWKNVSTVFSWHLSYSKAKPMMDIWYDVINQPCVSNETYLSDNVLYGTFMTQHYSIFIHNNTLINLIYIYWQHNLIFTFTY